MPLLDGRARAFIYQRIRKRQEITNEHDVSSGGYEYYGGSCTYTVNSLLN